MKIHFIGIGGIGVSALAQYYLSRGFAVSGSDLTEGAMIKILKEKGARVSIGPHKAVNVPRGADLVIFTNAAEKSNPELLAAKKLGIKTKSYPRALGELTKKMRTIAISGMHGKSTTTAMAALAAVSAGLDPTVIVGTKLKEFGSANFRAGESLSGYFKGAESSEALAKEGGGDLLIIEADEYKAALLNHRPEVAIVLNLEEEHLDFYRDLEHIKKTFAKFLKNIRPGGAAILNRDDKNTFGLKKETPRSVHTKTFSLNDPEIQKIKKILKVPGRHNLSNALAVYRALEFLGVNEKEILKGLGKFQGVWRRLEYKGKLNGASVYDDYGHHPTEIKATLKAARELLISKSPKAPIAPKPAKTPRLWCVFQPHQYQRTYKLFSDFKEAFNEADEVLLLDIYSVAGREKESIKKKVSAEKLSQAISRKSVRYAESFSRAAEILRAELKRGDVCLLMGAGDIVKLSESLIADR